MPRTLRASHPRPQATLRHEAVDGIARWPGEINLSRRSPRTRRHPRIALFKTRREKVKKKRAPSVADTLRTCEQCSEKVSVPEVR
jgi:hypothetical protein